MYAPKYEAGGRFWPIVHDSTIFSLVLMHIIAIGIFGLKKLPLASSLIIPLPILTLLFHEYCQKRFLPIFKAYPNEVLGVPIILIFLIPQFYCSTQYSNFYILPLFYFYFYFLLYPLLSVPLYSMSHLMVGKFLCSSMSINVSYDLVELLLLFMVSCVFLSN